MFDTSTGNRGWDQAADANNDLLRALACAAHHGVLSATDAVTIAQEYVDLRMLLHRYIRVAMDSMVQEDIDALEADIAI